MSSTTGSAGEAAKALPTGLTNEVYDLVLVLQQAAADAVRYAAFSQDARAASDHELADWFADLAASDREIVARASRLLVPRLEESVTAADRSRGDQPNS